jgi:enterochelin esterase-like enzyme
MLWAFDQDETNMARKTPAAQSGRLIFEQHSSRILADNPLKDPATRTLPIYVPAIYDEPRYKNRRFPVLFDLVGYTGSGPSHVGWRSFDENVPERLDRLISEKKMPPCIVVFPDCFTALGGNQYINSSAIGRYADYLTRELIPFVDKTLRTLGSREHRACFGKSSGGYGAIVHGMKYAKYWGAVGNHSGDAYFDFVYKAEWPQALTSLQNFIEPALKQGIRKRIVRQRKPGVDDGRIKRFLEYCWSNEKPSGGDITTLMMICMAATYDPDPKAPGGFRLPFDLNTGELLPKRWEKWRKHDPIHMVGQYRDNLKTLRGIYIDCGWRDQYHIHFGTRLLSEQLHKHNIAHRYEEFNDNHSGVDYRMDQSLPYLARRIA